MAVQKRKGPLATPYSPLPTPPSLLPTPYSLLFPTYELQHYAIKRLDHKNPDIEIRTKRLVNDSFAGEYHSVFKGRGMEFEEVRPYQPGDDVRTIDWNVTARTGEPYVKRFVEERELTVMLVVDASASENFWLSSAFQTQNWRPN